MLFGGFRMNGEVREWLKRSASKADIPERVSGVRIPPSPPEFVFLPKSGVTSVTLLIALLDRKKSASRKYEATAICLVSPRRYGYSRGEGFMAHKTATICINVKTDEGKWKFFRPALKQNGSIRDGWALVDGARWHEAPLSLVRGDLRDRLATHLSVFPEDHQVITVAGPTVGSRHQLFPTDLYGTFRVLEFEVVVVQCHHCSGA
jgi:hypothetical protein